MGRLFYHKLIIAYTKVPGSLHSGNRFLLRTAVVSTGLSVIIDREHISVSAENRGNHMTMEPEIRKTSTAMAQGEARTAAAEAAAQARLAWPDWIRGAAMIGVISVHVSGVSGFPDNPLLLWLNSFVMAVFFFVSGSLMRNSRECSAAEYARRKAAAILWPYLTFSACAVLFDIAVLKLQGGNITRDLIRLWLRCVFTLVGRGTLWFLPVFYFACVLAWIVRNRRIPAVLLFLAGLAVMAFMNEIFGATVAVLTGGGDGIGSDIYLVAIRSLAAAAVILEGFWTGPLLDRLTLSKYGTPAALLSFARLWPLKTGMCPQPDTHPDDYILKTAVFSDFFEAARKKVRVRSRLQSGSAARVCCTVPGGQVSDWNCAAPDDLSGLHHAKGNRRHHQARGRQGETEMHQLFRKCPAPSGTDAVPGV